MTTDGKPFLGVYFECCRVYGRIYRSDDKKVYAGRCPRCRRVVRAKVGKGGTTQRMFIATSR